MIKRAGEILNDLECSSNSPRTGVVPAESNLGDIARRQRIRKMPLNAEKNSENDGQMRLF